MKYFTDRIFYLDKDGALAHIAYLTSGNWVLSLLEEQTGWEWTFEGAYPTYEVALSHIGYREPVTLLQEEWNAA